MRHIILKKATLIVVCILLGTTSPAFSASIEKQYFGTSFDCAKVASKIEIKICEVKELADADMEMGSIYKNLSSILSVDEKNRLKSEQVNWLKMRNTSCNSSENIVGCVKGLYVQRIEILKNWKQPAVQQNSSTDDLFRRLLSQDKGIQQVAEIELWHLDIESRKTLSLELIKALKSGNYDIRKRTSRELIAIGAPGVPFLIKAYDDKDREVRMFIIQILGEEMGSAPNDIVPLLINGLKDADWLVRVVSTDALGKRINPTDEIINALVQATMDKDKTVRARACQALGHFGSSALSAAPALVNVLKSDGKVTHHQADIELMRHQAAIALGNIGSTSDEVISALISTLKDDTAFIRSAAAEALAKIGPASVPALLKALSDIDIYTRIEAVKALNEIGPVNPAVEPALVNALKDESSAVRNGAAYVLRKIKTKSAQVAVEKYEEQERSRKEQKIVKEEIKLQQLYTKGEAVSTIQPDADHKFPLELVYAFSIVSWNSKELYVTLHRGKDRPDMLRIWQKIDDKYKILRELKSDEEGLSSFGQVEVVHYRVSENREPFIHVPIHTGRHRDDTFFYIMPDITLQEIIFEPATVWYKSKLQKDEEIWSDGQFNFTDDSLDFEFYIWRRGDAMCCPTAGKVTGTYKIIGSIRYDFHIKKDVADFKMIVDTFERHPVKE